MEAHIFELLICEKERLVSIGEFGVITKEGKIPSYEEICNTLDILNTTDLRNTIFILTTRRIEKI